MADILEKKMHNINRRDFMGYSAASLLTALSGCDKKNTSQSVSSDLFNNTKPSNVKIMIIGIDGATFDIIEPMIANSKLPQFKQLINTGTYARFRSEKPMLSPALWTTIATGHNRMAHGIVHFLSQGAGGKKSKKLISTLSRKKLALWNIVSPFNKTVDSVGWWVTWPAESVNGHIVSDRVAHSRWGSWTQSNPKVRLTYPETLLEEIRPFIVNPLSPPIEEINHLVTLTDQEKAELLAAKQPVFAHGLSVLKYGYCAQRTYEEIALHMLSKNQPDLGMIFLIGIDPICHTFWHYFKPEQFKDKVDSAVAERLGKLIPAMYEHTDNYLERVLSKIDPDTIVFIVSDHGFQATGNLPSKTSLVSYQRFGIDRIEQLDKPVNVGMSGRHHLDGVFIASGGPILSNAIPLKQPCIADITPTILALMGLPVGKDMPGRVLKEIIDPKFLAKYPVKYIDTYEGLIQRHQLSDIGAAGEDAQLKYIRSLGYVE